MNKFNGAQHLTKEEKEKKKCGKNNGTFSACEKLKP